MSASTAKLTGILATIAICLGLGLLTQSYATIIHVPDDFEIIQDAIDATDSGDTVLIATGEYIEQLTIEDHGLTLASEFLISGDTSIISQTILSGDNSFRVITIDSLGLDETVSIIGLNSPATPLMESWRFRGTLFSIPTKYLSW